MGTGDTPDPRAAHWEVAGGEDRVSLGRELQSGDNSSDISLMPQAKCASPPLGHVPGCLQEPCVVVLLQDVLCLVDEDCGALQTLPAVSHLLSQLPQLHHLREEQREARVLRNQNALRKPHPKPGVAQEQ